jgi:hypothetical protein
VIGMLPLQNGGVVEALMVSLWREKAVLLDTASVSQSIKVDESPGLA